MVSQHFFKDVRTPRASSKGSPLFSQQWLGSLEEPAFTGELPPTIDHAADANARLSLDPTGKVAGYQVTQDDESNLIVHTFNGDGADADAGLWVTGAGSSVGGPYTFNGSDTYTHIPDDSTPCVFSSPGVGWNFSPGNVLYVGDNTSTYAWQVSSWTALLGTPPPPTVIRNPIASEANWSQP